MGGQLDADTPVVLGELHVRSLDPAGAAVGTHGQVDVEPVGADLLDEDSDEIVDVVLLWWRDEDGDLVDTLVDARAPLADTGVIWVLTPKTGRDGHVEPSDIAEAAPTVGLAQTSNISVSDDWAATRLATPKAAKAKR